MCLFFTLISLGEVGFSLFLEFFIDVLWGVCFDECELLVFVHRQQEDIGLNS
jgi:hypothetical protein